MFEDIFDSMGLPSELKYVSIIESALNPNAVNRYTGATGLWQFMFSTGRMYGLTINSVVDERRDPVKATYAAAKFMKDLYDIYHDWLLVIAAYNCGPGNVNKAIRRSGNKKDYWEIYYRLPRETRGYIPAYVAATYAMNYYREHNITPVQIDLPLAIDTVMVTKDIHLEQIAAVLDLPMEELKALNPQYRTGLVPGKTRPSSITLPVDRLGEFIDMTDTITGYRKDQYLTRVNQTSASTQSTYTAPDVNGKTKLIYVVKDGDNLGFISTWYNVRVSDLRYWNNIRANTIRGGQKLIVYVPKGKEGIYKNIDFMSFEEKQKGVGKTIPPTSAISSPVPEALTASYSAEYEYYTVRSGDTLWDIAKKYPGISDADLIRLNNLQDGERIQPGQVIKIKKKS